MLHDKFGVEFVGSKFNKISRITYLGTHFTVNFYEFKFYEYALNKSRTHFALIRSSSNFIVFDEQVIPNDER